MNQMKTPSYCPNCGAEVPPGAKACRECGSCEKTGWSDESYANGLDLPDTEFDYEEYVNREFHSDKVKPRGIPWFWWLVAVLVLLAFVSLLWPK
jgi:hypothetical protein